MSHVTSLSVSANSTAVGKHLGNKRKVFAKHPGYRGKSVKSSCCHYLKNEIHNIYATVLGRECRPYVSKAYGEKQGPI